MTKSNFGMQVLRFSRNGDTKTFKILRNINFVTRLVKCLKFQNRASLVGG